MSDDHGATRTLSRRLRTVGLNVAVLLASLLVAFLVAEALTRWLRPQQLILKRPDVWLATDTLGWIHRPFVSTTINTGERTVRLFTDREGFRVGAAGRIEAEKKILLLGDSFMEALQVEYEQSVAGLLETRLVARLGAPVAVRNTAVGGWGPDQYLLQARSSLGRQRFDLVVVALYLGNDVTSVWRDYVSPRTPKEVHRFRLPRRLNRREWNDAIFYPINDFLEVRSHLFILLKQQAKTALMRLGLTAAYFPLTLSVSEASSVRWDVTAAICKDLADLAARSGTPTLFVLIPTPMQVDERQFQQHLDGFGIDPASVDLLQPNRLLTPALLAYDLNVVDLLAPLKQKSEAGAQLYGTIDSHFTPAGHELVASYLEPIILDYLETQVEAPTPTAAPSP